MAGQNATKTTKKTVTATPPNAKTTTATSTAAKKTTTKSTTKSTAKRAVKKSPAGAAGNLTVDALMTPNPLTCGPGADLGEAAMKMWEGDCGALPVIGAEREVVGIITDRDICMALAMTGVGARDRSVGDVMSSPVVRCRPDEDAQEALTAMAEHRVRRLPVTDAEGRLAGMLSLSDLVRRKTPVLADAALLKTLRSVVEPHAKKGQA